MDEMQEHRATIEYNGHTADLDDKEAAAGVVEEAVMGVTRLRNGQTVMPGSEDAMFDRTAVIKDGIKDLIGKVGKATRQSVTRAKFVVETETQTIVDGQPFDVVTQTSMTMKPSKPEQG